MGNIEQVVRERPPLSDRYRYRYRHSGTSYWNFCLLLFCFLGYRADRDGQFISDTPYWKQAYPSTSKVFYLSVRNRHNLKKHVIFLIVSIFVV